MKKRVRYEIMTTATQGCYWVLYVRYTTDGTMESADVISRRLVV